MNHRPQIKTGIFFSILFAASVFASGEKTTSCTFNDPSFASRQFVKLKIEGPKPPVQHVLSEPKECPAKGPCQWQMKEVIPPSMKMLAGKSFEGFTCVKRKLPFNNVKIVGWVPTKNLNFLK